MINAWGYHSYKPFRNEIPGLVNVNKKLWEKHHAINGKTHYFYGNVQRIFVCLPEGNPTETLFTNDLNLLSWKLWSVELDKKLA